MHFYIFHSFHSEMIILILMTLVKTDPSFSVLPAYHQIGDKSYPEHGNNVHPHKGRRRQDPCRHHEKACDGKGLPIPSRQLPSQEEDQKECECGKYHIHTSGKPDTILPRKEGRYCMDQYIVEGRMDIRLLIRPDIPVIKGMPVLHLHILIPGLSPGFVCPAFFRIYIKRVHIWMVCQSICIYLIHVKVDLLADHENIQQYK